MFLPLRDDTPHRITPVVNYGLIAACAVVFLWQLSLGDRGDQVATFVYGLIPGRLLGTINVNPRLAQVPPWMTIFTSMFMHGGWLHILGNMLYLWIFGASVEAALGHVRYLAFYLLCGVAAALAQTFAAPAAAVPMIGASGAISGVLGAYFILYPRANIRVLVFLIFIGVINLPAFVVLGFWFLAQLLSSAAASASQPGVAFTAHIGGFITGAVLVFFFRRRGVDLFQSPASRAFSVERRPYRGSVPNAGNYRRGPWG